MNSEWIAGAVVVAGLALCLACPLIYGIWDVVRLRRGENLSVTASHWMSLFLARHPIVALTGGLAAGILIGHFAWFQVFCP